MDHTLIEKALQGNLIEDLGLESLPEEQKLNLIASVTELIGTRIIARVMEGLPVADREEFMTMIDAGSLDSVIPWLLARGIMFEELILEEVAKARDELKTRADLI